MPHGPVVSLVIPAYNAAGYVGAAIESCQRQSESDVEILVVDDGSTDATADVVRRYLADPRVQLIEMGVNSGVSQARNAALDRATGTWIATVDADDWMAPNRLEVLLDAADRHRADMVNDDLLLIHEGAAQPYSTLTEACNFVIEREAKVDMLRLIDCEVGGTTSYRLGLTQPMIRRSILETNRLRYDETLRVGEDFLLYLECLMAGALWIQIPGAYYYYMRRQGSATSAPQVPTLESKLAVCEQLLRRPSLRGSQRASLIRYRRNLTSLLAYQRVVEPAKQRSFGAAAKAAANNPSFVRRAAHEVPAIARRRWAHYVRRDPHAYDMLR